MSEGWLWFCSVADGGRGWNQWTVVVRKEEGWSWREDRSVVRRGRARGQERVRRGGAELARGQERGGSDEGRKLQKCSIFSCFGDEKKKFLCRCINFVKKRGDRGGFRKNDVVFAGLASSAPAPKNNTVILQDWWRGGGRCRSVCGTSVEKVLRLKEELVRRGGGMALGQWMGACRRPRGDGRRMDRLPVHGAIDPSRRSCCGRTQARSRRRRRC